MDSDYKSFNLTDCFVGIRPRASDRNRMERGAHPRSGTAGRRGGVGANSECDISMRALCVCYAEVYHFFDPLMSTWERGQGFKSWQE